LFAKKNKTKPSVIEETKTETVVIAEPEKKLSFHDIQQQKRA